MSTDINATLDSFSLVHLHQKNFYGNFLFLNKILKLWRLLYDLNNINNMLTFFFHIFIAVLSDEEGVVQNQNPHQSATTSPWKHITELCFS